VNLRAWKALHRYFSQEELAPITESGLSLPEIRRRLDLRKDGGHSDSALLRALGRKKS
jgi:hypothetical protein